MKLRPYQSECVERIFSELSENDSTLAVLPTGCGKTVIFSNVCSRWENGRVLVMAHRDELIRQAADKIAIAIGEQPEIEMGDSRANTDGLHAPSHVVVTSVQTMCRESRHSRFNPRDFGLLITDEAHHATAQTYRKVIDYFSQGGGKHLGVTATPNRSDERALGLVYRSVAYNYEVLQAINDGWLVPIHQEMIYVKDLDFSGIKRTAGDLNAAQLERVMLEERALHEVAAPTVELAGDESTLVFAAGVQQAHELAKIFTDRYGKTAIALDGGTDTEERRRVIKSYQDGDIQILCNCGLFTEGFDAPRTSVVVMARPTTSHALYAQMLGRGTRPLPGIVDAHDTALERQLAIEESAKPRMLVLDFVGNCGRHKLVSAADILGGDYSEEVIERAKEEQKKSGKPGEVRESLEAAKELMEEERREARKQIAAKASYDRQRVDPFEVIDFVPGREPGWHKGRPATEKQMDALKRAGFTDKDLHDVGFWKAHKLLDTLSQRRAKELCTVKQAKILARYGESTEVGFREASRIIDEIAANGWKPRMATA